MKRGVFILAVCLVLSSYSMVYAEDFEPANFTVIIDIPASAGYSWAKVELNTSQIDFGYVNVSNESVDEVRAKYAIRNAGNVNISVTPTLIDPSDGIFKELEFARIYSSWKKIGNYSIELNQTNRIGEWNDWFVQSVRLDLNDVRNNFGKIPFDLVDHNNTVIFEIMQR
jgi:hypothetical protein